MIFNPDLYVFPVYMENYCGEELSMIISSVHQFKLELNDRSLFEDGPCETHIEAWFSYPKIMFYFDELDLDCNDGYLQFFSGRNYSTRVEGNVINFLVRLCIVIDNRRD